MSIREATGGELAEPLLITAMELGAVTASLYADAVAASQRRRAAATGPFWRDGAVASGRSPKMDRGGLSFAARRENERRRE